MRICSFFWPDAFLGRTGKNIFDNKKDVAVKIADMEI
jgi:hypothetical protein